MIKLPTVPEPKMFVKAFMTTKYSNRNPRGSGYCEEQEMVQQLVKRTFFRMFFFWIGHLDEVVDSEVVPSFVWISNDTLGFDASGWKSKFKEYIPAK